MASPMAETADIVIIGSGIAGLAAGCYAQMNGYRTHILEAQNSPGGLCTALSRQGYVLDGGLHYIFGTSPGQPFYSMWEELGAVQGLEFVNQTLFMQVQRHEGEALNVYSNPDELEAHLKALSPQDAKLIEQFCNGVRTFKAFDLSMLQQKPKALMTGADWAKVGRRVLPFVAIARQVGQSLPERFGHPVQTSFFANRRSSNVFLARCAGDGGDVAAGLFRQWQCRLPGGWIVAVCRGNCPALPRFGWHDRVRLSGRTGDGRWRSRHWGASYQPANLPRQPRHLCLRWSPHAVSPAPGQVSQPPARKALYRQAARPFAISDVSGPQSRPVGQPHWVTHLLDQPLTLAGAEHREVGVKHYSFDPSLAPAGKSVMMAMVTTPYVHWQNTYGEQPIATTNLPEVQTVLDCLDTLYPGLANDVEVMEVSTPLSLEQRSDNWQGASSGWLLTKETLPLMIKGVPKRLPGLEAFYMAGQWIRTGRQSAHRGPVWSQYYL